MVESNYEVVSRYYIFHHANKILGPFDENAYSYHLGIIRETVESPMLREVDKLNKIQILYYIKQVYLVIKPMLSGDYSGNRDRKLDLIKDIINYIDNRIIELNKVADSRINGLSRKEQPLKQNNITLTFKSSFNYIKLGKYLTEEDKYFAKSGRDDLLRLFEGKVLKRTFAFLGKQKNILGTMFWDLSTDRAFTEESNNKKIKIYICKYFTFKDKLYSKAVVNKYITTSRNNKRLPISKNDLKIDISKFFYPEKEKQ